MLSTREVVERILVGAHRDDGRRARHGAAAGGRRAGGLHRRRRAASGRRMRWAIQIALDHPLCRKLHSRRDALARDDFDDEPDLEVREACRDVFDQLEVELLVPILFGAELLGADRGRPQALGRPLRRRRPPAAAHARQSDPRSRSRTPRPSTRSPISTRRSKRASTIARESCTRPRRSSCTARRCVRSDSSWRASPTSSTTRSASYTPTSSCSRSTCRSWSRRSAPARTRRTHRDRDREAAGAQPRGNRARQADRRGPANLLADGPGGARRRSI